MLDKELEDVFNAGWNEIDHLLGEKHAWSREELEKLSYRTRDAYHKALIRAEKVEAELARIRAEAMLVRAAVDVWEAGGDDELLVNMYIDPWLKSLIEGQRYDD